MVVRNWTNRNATEAKICETTASSIFRPMPAIYFADFDQRSAFLVE